MLCAAAYLIKCGYEVAQRRLNVPKTLHMTLASSLFFITPALENLDVALQGFEHLALLPVQGPRHDRLGHGRPIRRPRLGPVRRRRRVDRRLRRVLPRLARPGAPDRRLAGRHDAAALCLPYVEVLSGVLFHHYFDHFLLLRNDCITRSAPTRCYVGPVPMHIAATTVSVVC